MAANTTNNIIRKWNPRYLLLVGVAGGVGAAGVQLGDVLVPDQIIDYEWQKLTERGATMRPVQYPIDHGLLAVARNLKVNTWRKLIEVPRPQPGLSQCHVGPIASGDKVIASRAVLDVLRKQTSKLIGVEMEAGGVASATAHSVERPGFFSLWCAAPPTSPTIRRTASL